MLSASIQINVVRANSKDSHRPRSGFKCKGRARGHCRGKRFSAPNLAECVELFMSKSSAVHLAPERKVEVWNLVRQCPSVVGLGAELTLRSIKSSSHPLVSFPEALPRVD